MEKESTNTSQPKKTPEDESRIDMLKKELYSRTNEDVIERERRDLHERDFEVSEEWAPEEVNVVKKKKKPLLLILLAVSVLFFIGSVALSSLFFFSMPSISPNNVEIEVQGPASIGGGEELGLLITITNNNPVPINLADLLIEYPSGTRTAVDINTELPRYRESLGTINPGEQVKKTVRSVLFGEENSIKEIVVTVEFRVENSNAIFFNETNYQLLLSTSPLSLIIESLEEVISGQEVKFVATITSNSNDIIRDVVFEVEYPFGFELQTANPEPAFASRLWHLGDIPPEGSKTVTFGGTIIGQDGEERIFRFATGIQSESDPNILGTAFINVIESLIVKRPFITVNLALNGSTEDNFVVEAGKTVRADITWTNNLLTQIFDGEIEVIFIGDIINERSITAERGFYESLNNRIIWRRDTDPSLSSISSGESGRVSFTFSTLGLSSGIAFRNPEIGIEVSVRGKRLSDRQVPEEIISTLIRNIKISSDLFLTSKVLHSTGPFQNIGSLPPKAEQKTTYTVVWSVTNSSNQISGAQVVAALPSYIEWVGAVIPSQEEVVYNPIGGQVSWKLGDVSPGTGTATVAREIAFQVALIPSLSQIGTSPIVIGEQTLTGFDRFAEVNMSHKRAALTTRLTEPGFTTEGGTVSQ